MDTRDMPRARARRSLLLIVLMLFFLVSARAGLYGWSSVMPRSLQGLRIAAFATHEFFNEMAYGELKKHPAVVRGIVRLPALEEIQDHSAIDQGQGGNGPDNPALSDYSWHWFNPERGVPPSKTPLVVARYWSALRTMFLTQHLAGSAASSQGSGAHQAAYASHFIQDMTCPFHVVGMPIPPEASSREGAYLSGRGELVRPIADQFFTSVSGLASNDEMKTRIGGPFRRYSPGEWREVLGLALAAYHKDARADWFDPNYYDGGVLTPTKTSGHFLYEAAVEVTYKAALTANELVWDRFATDSSYVSPLWRNGMALEDYTRAMALETRQRMVPGSPLVVDSRRSAEVALATTPVPYNDWWRAIQATYTLWRASFSALWIGAGDVRLVKLPDGAGQYDVQVSVHNLEPLENVLGVTVAGEMPGRGFSGTAVVGHVAAGDQRFSAWQSLGPVRLDDPKRLTGTIRLTVKGEYRQTPDAQEAIFEYPISAIATEGEIPLLDMQGWPQQKARSYLENLGLVMDEEPGGNPRSDLDQHTVASHVPPGGTVVAKRDHVKVRVYGRYLVKVPDVTNPPLARVSAADLITRAKLTPIIEERETSRATPEGQAVEQSPPAGTMVVPQSNVQVWVARHRAEPQPAPTAPVRLKSVRVTPQESTIRLDQTVAFTATAIGADGSPLDEATLRQIRFGWGVSPDSAATISGSGNTAVLTPREAGPLSVVCFATWLAPAGDQASQRINFPRAASVLVLPAAPAPRPDGTTLPETPPPPRAQDDPCARLEKIFRAALAGGDVKTAAAILAEARDCPFGKEGLRALDQERDTQCQQIYGQIQAALRAGNRDVGAALLERGRAMGCQFPDTLAPDSPGSGPGSVSHELEGVWRARRGGMVVRFYKISRDSYTGILEANPENKPLYVKPGEEIMRATRTGEETYKMELAGWKIEDAPRVWLYGDRVYRVNGDESGYDGAPVAFDRIATPARR